MNTPTDRHFLENISHSRATKVILLIIFILAILGNGFQGFFLYKKAKAYREIKAVVDSKSNCEKCSTTTAPAETDATPTTTTPSSRSRSTGGSTSSDESSGTSESSGSSSQETVIPPPPPPSN
jgi:hypothetical protein